MKHLLIAFTSLFSFTLYGQETSTPTPTKGHDKLLIGINFSPDISYRMLSSNSYPRLVSYRNSNEKPKFGYTTGLNVNYNFSKKIGIEIGAQYALKGYATTKKELDYTVMLFDPSDFLNENGLLPTHYNDKFNFHTLDIPIRAMFSFGKKKVQFVTSIGVTTNILLKATDVVIYTYEDGSTQGTGHDISENYHKLNITPTISAGIAYQLNDHLKLNVEPTFRYALTNSSDLPYSEHLYSAGLNITCYYTLK